MLSEVQSVSGDDVDEDMKLVEHVAKSLRAGPPQGSLVRIDSLGVNAREPFSHRDGL